MKIVFFGKGLRGKFCLKQILNDQHEVVCFIGTSNEDESFIFAKNNNVKVYLSDNINNLISENYLKSFQADIFILAGYNKILKKNIIKIPKITTLNLHGGVLPSYRGAAPINWQIINGEKEGGCCVIEVDEGIDTGPIFLQEKYEIKIDDTHYSILDKTLKIFPDMLSKVLLNLEYYLKNKNEQNINEGSYYRRRYPSDSILNWSLMSNVEIYNLVRGMYGPYQWAYSFYDNIKVEFTAVKLLDVRHKVEPGKISEIFNNGVVIDCYKNAVLVNNVKVKNKIIDATKFFIKNNYLTTNVS